MLFKNSLHPWCVAVWVCNKAQCTTQHFRRNELGVYEKNYTWQLKCCIFSFNNKWNLRNKIFRIFSKISQTLPRIYQNISNHFKTFLNKSQKFSKHFKRSCKHFRRVPKIFTIPNIPEDFLKILRRFSAHFFNAFSVFEMSDETFAPVFQNSCQSVS